MESFFGSSAPSNFGPRAEAGARVKVMRWPATLRIGHATTLEGKAIQVSASGVGLLLSQSLRDGTTGLVRVDAFINGNPVRLQTQCVVVCCTCVGMEGFRISLRFERLDNDANDALDTLLRAR